DNSVKTLGIQWHPAVDNFGFKVQVINVDRSFTKREVLSDTAKLFDPLGILSPVTIYPKLFLQALWKLELGWDESIPEEIAIGWKHYRETLPRLEQIQIPRCVIVPNVINLQLHGFSDASERAYAAAVYIRSVAVSGSIEVHLLTSKTKVAPLKNVSLPRLELCGAVLLAKLMTNVHQALALNFNELHCWSDSTIVLAWINSASYKWKPFVANRITEIHECRPAPKWHHISGKDNPADLPSRGISPPDLQGNNLWWHGPALLHAPYH
ncbi:unnamed protein product, partial [Allacma fusca]